MTDHILNAGINGASTATVTTDLDVREVNACSIHIKEASGDYSGMILRMYCSPDAKVTWYQTSQITTALVNGKNYAFGFDTKGTDYIRFKVDVVSAGASTFDSSIVEG